jgi:Na+-transporting NADH:ubiquinone oxidoreductase subunit NqrC
MVISISAGAVAYSHYAQVRDRQTMRAGIERDKQMLRIKKQLRQQQQQETISTTTATTTTESNTDVNKET